MQSINHLKGFAEQHELHLALTKPHFVKLTQITKADSQLTPTRESLISLIQSSDDHDTLIKARDITTSIDEIDPISVHDDLHLKGSLIGEERPRVVGLTRHEIRFPRVPLQLIEYHNFLKRELSGEIISKIRDLLAAHLNRTGNKMDIDSIPYIDTILFTETIIQINKQNERIFDQFLIRNKIPIRGKLNLDGQITYNLDTTKSPLLYGVSRLEDH